MTIKKLNETTTFTNDHDDKLAAAMTLCNDLRKTINDLATYAKRLEDGLTIIADCKEDERFFTDSQVAEYYLRGKL